MIPIDFYAELQKLLSMEDPPIADPFTELARAQAEFARAQMESAGEQKELVSAQKELALSQAGLFDDIQKNGANLSLQLEEIYDIIKGADDSAKGYNAAIKRENMLLGALVSMGDLLEGLLPYLHEHSQTVAVKMGDVLYACGLARFGSPGEPFDTRLHTAASAEYSDIPFESITRVLESGYAYQGKMIRKATVILSKGNEKEGNDNQENDNREEDSINGEQRHDESIGAEEYDCRH